MCVEAQKLLPLMAVWNQNWWSSREKCVRSPYTVISLIVNGLQIKEYEVIDAELSSRLKGMVSPLPHERLKRTKFNRQCIQDKQVDWSSTSLIQKRHMLTTNVK